MKYIKKFFPPVAVLLAIVLAFSASLWVVGMIGPTPPDEATLLRNHMQFIFGFDDTMTNELLDIVLPHNISGMYQFYDAIYAALADEQHLANLLQANEYHGLVLLTGDETQAELADIIFAHFTDALLLADFDDSDTINQLALLLAFCEDTRPFDIPNINEIDEVDLENIDGLAALLNFILDVISNYSDSVTEAMRPNISALLAENCPCCHPHIVSNEETLDFVERLMWRETFAALGFGEESKSILIPQILEMNFLNGDELRGYYEQFGFDNPCLQSIFGQIDWNFNALIDTFAAIFFGACVDEMDLGLLHPFAVYFMPLFGELATFLAEYLGVDLYDLDENTEFLLFTALHTALYMEVIVHGDRYGNLDSFLNDSHGPMLVQNALHAAGMLDSVLMDSFLIRLSDARASSAHVLNNFLQNSGQWVSVGAIQNLPRNFPADWVELAVHAIVHNNFQADQDAFFAAISPLPTHPLMDESQFGRALSALTMYLNQLFNNLRSQFCCCETDALIPKFEIAAAVYLNNFSALLRDWLIVHDEYTESDLFCFIEVGFFDSFVIWQIYYFYFTNLNTLRSISATGVLMQTMVRTMGIYAYQISSFAELRENLESAILFEQLQTTLLDIQAHATPFARLMNNDIVSDFPADYAGAFIDENNVLHILLTSTHNIELYRQAIDEGISANTPVFVQARFSLNELLTIQRTLSYDMILLGVEWSQPCQRNNVVEIQLLDPQDRYAVLLHLSMHVPGFNEHSVVFI